MTIEERQKQGELLNQYKQEFISFNVDTCGGDAKIINFIADIRFHGGIDVKAKDSIETIRCLFEAGFCFDFANILDRVFPGGEICYCYNFGHVVYVYEEIAYDISGVTDAEYEMFIPIKNLGELAKDFEHRPELAFNATEQDIIDIGDKCRKEHLYVFALTNCKQDIEIVQKCKAIANNDSSFNEYEKEILSKSITQEDFENQMIDYCIKNNLSWKLIQRLRNM